MSGFSNPLVGGGGGLVYPSIHSPNFVHGSAGWSINKDGTLEANSAAIRGTVTAGMFAGTQFVINSLGAFFYSGAPALGNLIASIAPAGGANDGLGNAFDAGFTRYQGTGYIEVDSGGGAPVVFFRPDGATHISTVSQIVATIQFPAAVNEQEILQITSGAESGGDQALYQLLAEAADASTGAEHLFIVGLVTVFQVTKLQLTSVKVHFFSAGIHVTGGAVSDTLNLSSTLFVGGAATLNGGLKSTGNAEFDLSVTFPTGDAAESIPMKAFPTVSGSGATRFLVTQLRTAQVAGAPAGALAGINFDSTSVDLTTTPATLVLFSQDGTNTNTVTLTPTKSALSSPVTATGGTPANPTLITTDTWHVVSSFSNGWMATASTVQRYRLNTDNSVEMDFVLTPGTITDFTTMFTLPNSPVNYRPNVVKFLSASTAGGTAITNGPAARIDPGGTVSCLGLPTGCTQMRFSGRFTLDA